MKKHKICKILLVILAILLCVAFYELLGICIAYKKQPEVSNTTKKETKNGSWNECSENTERAVIIEKNPEALLQRVRLIQNAKEEIILSTFAFKSDESGKLILGALHDAADRGVHIRLLVDGMESWIDMEGNPYFYGLSSHENVEIKLYNKANPLKPWKMMGRMHDKYLIADGKTYILGGRNTYNYFLGDFPGHKNYDRDVSDFSIMTNSVANNGNPFGAADYAKNRNRILSTGINIWEYEGGYSYHGKSILIDDDLSVIGSFNMDMRSAYLDTELMLVIRSKDINKQLEEGMMEYERVSRQVLEDGTYRDPYHVEPIELTKKRQRKIFLVQHLLGWARYLF